MHSSSTYPAKDPRRTPDPRKALSQDMQFSSCGKASKSRDRKETERNDQGRRVGYRGGGGGRGSGGEQKLSIPTFCFSARMGQTPCSRRSKNRRPRFCGAKNAGKGCVNQSPVKGIGDRHACEQCFRARTEPPTRSDGKRERAATISAFCRYLLCAKSTESTFKIAP